MFEQIKVEVGSIVPDYLKTIYSMKSLASCEQPTTDFILKLAQLILPNKTFTIGDPQDQSNVEESKKPHKELDQNK